MTTTRIAPPFALPELDALLLPVAGEKPSGESLRYDALYDDVKRLREEDDPTLPQGVWQRELKRADWPGVATLTTEALAKRSKDLQLAAWLTEAWVKTYGFAGLARGLRLVTGLCANFWETLHPALDEGSLDARMAPIGWLAGEKFLLTVRSVAITAPAGEDAVAYAWTDWQALLRKPEQAKVLVSASLTPGAYFITLSRDLAAAVDALDALKALLIEKAGEADAPSLSPLRNTLTDIADFVARARQDRPDAIEEIPAMELVPQPVPDDAPPPDSAAPAPAHIAGPVTNRAEAYLRLREASDFLMRTEPHSPVPYLVRRAISWGNMSLAEVLQELLHKNADLATIYTLLGITQSEIKGR